MIGLDPDYVVQGCYSDSTICESTGSDSEAEASRMARDMFRDPCFEGDYVRVITRDGELVCEYR